MDEFEKLLCDRINLICQSDNSPYDESNLQLSLAADENFEYFLSLQSDKLLDIKNKHRIFYNKYYKLNVTLEDRNFSYLKDWEGVEYFKSNIKFDSIFNKSDLNPFDFFDDSYKCKFRFSSDLSFCAGKVKRFLEVKYGYDNYKWRYSQQCSDEKIYDKTYDGKRCIVATDEGLMLVDFLRSIKLSFNSKNSEKYLYFLRFSKNDEIGPEYLYRINDILNDYTTVEFSYYLTESKETKNIDFWQFDKPSMLYFFYKNNDSYVCEKLNNNLKFIGNGKLNAFLIKLVI